MNTTPSNPAQSCQATTERAEIGALTRLAAECHRAKWEFDLSEDYRPSPRAARALILSAFQQLHRIGNIALRDRDAIRAVLQSEKTP